VRSAPACKEISVYISRYFNIFFIQKGKSKLGLQIRTYFSRGKKEKSYCISIQVHELRLALYLYKAAPNANSSESFFFIYLSPSEQGWHRSCLQ